MRSMWNGYISFGVMSIPVKLYSASDSKSSVSFNQLHANCNGRLKQEKKCSKCGEQVATKDIVKGYQFAKDQYVVVEEKELKDIQVKSDKTITLAGFVDLDTVSPMLFDTPFFVGPENEAVSKVYGLLLHSLKASGKAGIGKVVMRDREEPVAISVDAEGKGLVLFKLRYPQQIKSIDEVPIIDKIAMPDDAELKMGMQYVDMIPLSLEEVEMSDARNEALLALVEAKVSGDQTFTAEAPAEAAAPVAADIMDLLRQSIDEHKAAAPKVTRSRKKTPKSEEQRKQA